MDTLTNSFVSQKKTFFIEVDTKGNYHVYNDSNKKQGILSGTTDNKTFATDDGSGDFLSGLNLRTLREHSVSAAKKTSPTSSPVPQAPNIDKTTQIPATENSNLLDIKINEDTLKNIKFGDIDSNLKNTNLQYPKDALYNKTQDYLQIGQYHYRPPKSNQLFNGTEGAGDIIKNGLQKSSALKEFLGIVKLPMPNNVTDSNNVSCGDDNMNNLSAAATAEIMGDLKRYGSAGVAGGLIGAFTGGSKQGAGLGVKLALLEKILSNSGGSLPPSAQSILATAGTSQILSMAGFSVSPESILARGFGVVPNSNLELLFNSPTLREFTFQYRLSPRSREEATDVNKIIRFFKQGMAAKKQNGKAGLASYFLGTPNVFQLQYKTSGGNPIKGVNRIKTCALTGFAMNYTADGNWAAYDEGQPVSVIMNMSFKELEPIYDTDYQENIFEGRTFTDKTNDSGDLYKISNEDVGY